MEVAFFYFLVAPFASSLSSGVSAHMWFPGSIGLKHFSFAVVSTHFLPALDFLPCGCLLCLRTGRWIDVTKFLIVQCTGVPQLPVPSLFPCAVFHATLVFLVHREG